MNQKKNKTKKPMKPAKTKQPAKVRLNLFGIHAVREAWLNPSRFVNHIFITQEAMRGFESVITQAQKQGLKRPAPEIIEKEKLAKMLPPGAVHQGIAMQAQALAEKDIRDLVIAAGDENSVLAILDQVTDPHNVGAILRSACAFGLKGLVMQSKHAPALEGVLAKTACGAAEHIPVAYETNLSRAIEYLQQEGYFVIGLDERGEQPLSSYRHSGKTAIVLGAEGPGIRRLVAEKCDALYQLPTQPPIASLNVSTAAAVAFYELVRG